MFAHNPFDFPPLWDGQRFYMRRNGVWVRYIRVRLPNGTMVWREMTQDEQEAEDERERNPAGP